MTIVFAVLLVAMAIWTISAYNRLIGLKGQTLNGWKQIDVQLKRRHDLIPNLVNAVVTADWSCTFMRDIRWPSTLTGVTRLQTRCAWR